MRELVEHACILLYDGTDLEELENHLSMNGYHFGIDVNRSLLFVLIDELAYVKTILTDRDIGYAVMVC